MSALATEEPIVAGPFPIDWTLEDLLDYLGGIPANRVLLYPTPGTATEADLLRLEAAPNKRLCELIDGILVEKGMGFFDSVVGLELGTDLKIFLRQHDLGIAAGEQGMMRLSSRRIRMPDLSFVSWDQFPGREVPNTPVPAIYPDLAVGVLSLSNTPREMQLKREDYFNAGTKLVWEIDPRTETVRVFTSADEATAVTLTKADTLDGGDVLPGFRLAIREMFDRARRGTRA